jgi:hypothetical protein
MESECCSPRLTPHDLIQYSDLDGLPTEEDLTEQFSYILPGSDTEPVSFTGRLLGIGSSYRPYHTHPEGTYADRPTTASSSKKCSACRWFELRVFSVDEPIPGVSRQVRYLVYFAGVSVVPGEHQRCRYEAVSTAWEVIEAMTLRQRLASGESNVYLSTVASRALAMAAGHDADLREAYINRAVP